MLDIIHLDKVNKFYVRKKNFYGKIVEKTQALKDINFITGHNSMCIRRIQIQRLGIH